MFLGNARSLSEDLENLHNLLKANKVTLNMTKTEFILIGSRQRLGTVTVSLTLGINHFRVTQVATAKSLGITIDDSLDWGSHMEEDNKASIFWHWGHKASKAPCASSDLTTNLPSSYSRSLQLLQYWDNLKEQTSKITK